jgi:hypothetical protein
MIEKDKGTFARALLAGVAIVAIPIVAAGAQTHSIVRDNPPPKRTCDVRTTLGTRLGNTVTCRTKAERDQLKKDGRETVERVQMRRVLPGG